VVARHLDEHVRIAVPTRDEVARRPDLLRVDGRGAPRRAELDLVLAGEIIRVAADVALRPIALVLVERVVRHEPVVEVVVLVETTDGRELEPAVDERDLRRGEEPAADDEVAFTFVVLGRAGLVPRGFGRTRRAGAAA